MRRGRRTRQAATSSARGPEGTQARPTSVPAPLSQIAALCGKEIACWLTSCPMAPPLFRSRREQTSSAHSSILGAGGRNTALAADVRGWIQWWTSRQPNAGAGQWRNSLPGRSQASRRVRHQRARRWRHRVLQLPHATSTLVSSKLMPAQRGLRPQDLRGMPLRRPRSPRRPRPPTPTPRPPPLLLTGPLPAPSSVLAQLL